MTIEQINVAGIKSHDDLKDIPLSVIISALRQKQSMSLSMKKRNKLNNMLLKAAKEQDPAAFHEMERKVEAELKS